ncbi:MAG: DUF4258 domain-containing protein [Nitrospiraceae bacterium]|nr:DUF4258 domain-containing protein [Nitrospiraceae bacterium]
MSETIKNYIVTPHAVLEMQRRGIGDEVLRQVLISPEWRETVREGRDILQSRISFQGSIYLVRVFVDVDREPAEIVTVYRTSKMNKYWKDMS